MTVNKNKDSLRWQIIDAMHDYAKEQGFADRPFDFNVQMFDEAIMPVLDAAMKAGELLLHRATTPQPTVPEAIVTWLEGCCRTLANIRMSKRHMSRKAALHTLQLLEEGAMNALADAKALTTETTSLESGSQLAGQSLPMKG